MNHSHSTKRTIVFALLACLFACFDAHAQYRDDMNDFNYSYSQQFYFKLDKYNIDETLGNNAQSIDSILYKVRDLKQQGAKNLRLRVIGSASLEASEEYNKRLSFNRSNNVVEYLRKFSILNDVEIYTVEGLYDWTVLRDKVAQSDCPCYDDMLAILHNDNINVSTRKQMVKELCNGAAYDYIDKNFFKFMRYASMRITAYVPGLDKNNKVEEPVATVPAPAGGNGPIMAIRTNLLYDVAAVPNIGVDFWVGSNISVGVNWMYGWWKNDHKNIYWRTYGGDIHADYWFDPTLKWTGHHLGVYAQMGTYDFEWKGKGYQLPKWGWGGGIDYGYSVWLSKHFSLDFNIGLGYFGGKYYKYVPSEVQIDKYYYEINKKESTKNLHWFGPTKLEVSLIWKIGKE